MMKSYITVVTVLYATTCSLIKPTQCQCSIFTYTTHPPVPLDCRPFSNGLTPTWQLTTTCTAERDATNFAIFEVRWFQRDTNGAVRFLVPSSFSFDLVTARAVSTFGGTLRNMPFNENMLGQYWCQVYINGFPVPAYSDSFTILRPEEYDNQLPVCNTRQQINVDICLDTPPPAPVPSSTQASPSLIPSTTISSINEQTTTSTVPIATAIPSSTMPVSLIPSSITTLIEQITTSTVPIPAAIPSSNMFTITTPMATISTHVDQSTTTVTAKSVMSTPSYSNTTIATPALTPAAVGTSSRDLAIMHSIYCVIIVLIGILSVSVIAVTCCKERVKKMFKQVPVYVEMLETRLYATPLNTKRSTHQVGNSSDTQVTSNRVDTMERNEYYKSLETSTMSSNIEQQYTTVNINIQ